MTEPTSCGMTMVSATGGLISSPMQIDPEKVEVRLQEEYNRFVAPVGEYQGVIEYRLVQGRIAFLHTEVPPELEGQGLANRMARVALDYAREQGLEVLPHCPFIRAFIKRHPEYEDLTRAANE